MELVQGILKREIFRMVKDIYLQEKEEHLDKNIDSRGSFTLSLLLESDSRGFIREDRYFTREQHNNYEYFWNS